MSLLKSMHHTAASSSSKSVQIAGLKCRVAHFSSGSGSGPSGDTGRRWRKNLGRMSDADSRQRLLTLRLKSAVSPVAVFGTLRGEVQKESFNAFHVCAAFTRLAQLVREGWSCRDIPEQDVVKLLARFRRLEQQLDNRAFANIMWSVAVLKDELPAVVGSLPTLLQAMQLHIAGDTEGFSMQNVANMMWAVATLHSEEVVSVDVASCMKILVPNVAVACLRAEASKDNGSGSPQHIANILWATAVLELESPDELLAVLLPLLRSQLRAAPTNFKEQELAISLWSAASLHLPQIACAEISAVIVERLRTGYSHLFQAKELSNIMWAVARLQHLVSSPSTAADAKVIMAVVLDRLKVPTSFSEQSFSNIWWSAATMHFPASSRQLLLERSLPCLGKRLGYAQQRFTAQGFSNMLWAAATMHQQIDQDKSSSNAASMAAAKLLSPAITARLKNSPSSFNCQEIVTLCWAVAVFACRRLR